jgi:hypothetical protein
LPRGIVEPFEHLFIELRQQHELRRWLLVQFVINSFHILLKFSSKTVSINKLK